MTSNMLLSGDGISALVFDLGSHSFRIGYSQDTSPKADIPSAVGVMHCSTVDTTYFEPEVKRDNRINQSVKYYIDITSLCVPREGMKVVNCMKDGMIHDWDLLEQMLDYAYSKCLLTESQYHPVLFSESPGNIKPKRETLAEIMFEKYKVPAFYLCKNAVLAAFATGRSTCLIVDSGATHTSVVPVQDGCVIPKGVVTSPLGGNFIRGQCKKYFAENKIKVIPHYMIAQKEPVLENKTPIWRRKTILPKVTNSWHEYMCDSVIHDFQQSALQISEFPYNEELVSSLPTCNYEFPNGYNKEFGNERFQIPETLFEPPLGSGGSMLSVGHIITTSVGMCDVDLRPHLYNNIVVTGGNSLIQGFPERINRDLIARLPSSTRLRIIAPNGTMERRFGAWMGGSVLASIETFQQLWISQKEYNDGGKRKIDSKFD